MNPLKKAMKKAPSLKKPKPATKKGPPKRPVRPPPEVSDDEDTSFADAISFGENAEEQIEQYQQRVALGNVLEFFFTKDEIKRNKGRASAEVHFLRNYADKRNMVSVPRVTIMENGRPRSYTSPGNDCAIASAGVNVAVRPVYFLMDHRVFERQSGEEGTDQIKMFIPASSMQGLITTAIEQLADAVEVDVSDLDITRYRATITKVGTGRKSSWSISFLPREKPLTSEQKKAVAEFFQPSYKEKVRQVLAPDPRYMLSKGGRYVKPSRDAVEENEDEPPF